MGLSLRGVRRRKAAVTPPRAPAVCGELTHFSGGSRAIELQVQLGQVARKQRLPSERIEGARIATYELPIPLGRLRVVHEARESPGVSTCSVAPPTARACQWSRVTTTNTSMSSPAPTTRPSSAKRAKVCSPTIMGITLAADQEKELRIAILSPDACQRRPSCRHRHRSSRRRSSPRRHLHRVHPIMGTRYLAHLPPRKNAGPDYGEANP